MAVRLHLWVLVFWGSVVLAAWAKPLFEAVLDLAFAHQSEQPLVRMVGNRYEPNEHSRLDKASALFVV